MSRRLVVAAAVALVLSTLVWSQPSLAQPKGVKGPFPRPSDDDPYIIQLGPDVQLDCRGTFERVEQLREEVRDNPQRQPALDAAINSTQVCLDKGIEPPGGAASLGLSPEDFAEAEEGAEAKNRKKLEDKKKGKQEPPSSPNEQGTSTGGTPSGDGSSEDEAKDKGKKGELPRTGGTGSATLLALVAGALLVGGALLVRRLT